MESKNIGISLESFLKSRGAWGRYIYNTRHVPLGKFPVSSSSFDYICNAFVWERTREGDIYWRELDYK